MKLNGTFLFSEGVETVAAAAAEEEWGKMINLSRLKSLSTFNLNHSKKKERKISKLKKNRNSKFVFFFDNDNILNSYASNSINKSGQVDTRRVEGYLKGPKSINQRYACFYLQVLY